MSSEIEYRIEMTAGNTYNCEYTVKDAAGSAVNITGAELVCSVKQLPSDESYQFQRKNTAAGGGDTEIEMTDAANGKFELKFAKTNTESLEGNYHFDIWMKLSGYEKTIVQDMLIVEKGVK